MRVKRAELVVSVQIVADADRLTSRAGTALLVGLADRVGLTEGFRGRWAVCGGAVRATIRGGRCAILL